MILHLVLFPISIQHMFLSVETEGLSQMVRYQVSARRLIEELRRLRAALPDPGAGESLLVLRCGSLY